MTDPLPGWAWTPDERRGWDAMAKLVAAAVVLLLVVYALIDCLQTPRREVRGPSKAAWLAAILLLPFAGALAWLVSGRSRPQAAEPPARPVAPDDDPEFLRGVATLDEEHEAFLSRWEREEERRRRSGRPPGPADPGEPGRPRQGPEAPRDAPDDAGPPDPKAPREDEPRHEPGS